MTKRKGIILAGGSGSRLYPITMGVSKQLLPIYDKPMIFYPLSVIMLAGIKDIAVITTEADKNQFQRLLGDGGDWGISITYIVQPSPDGLAQAYILAEEFLDGSPSMMVLGDNIFFGSDLPFRLTSADNNKDGGTIFVYQVADPERYGVAKFDENNRVISLHEKPKVAPSNYAVTGMYFLDGSAPQRASKIVPSARGELEITSLLESYLNDKILSVEHLGRGFAWLDTGTHDSLLDSANFVRTLQLRQGLQIGCLEEISYRLGWMDANSVLKRAESFGKNDYGKYLQNLISTT